MMDLKTVVTGGRAEARCLLISLNLIVHGSGWVILRQSGRLQSYMYVPQGWYIHEPRADSQRYIFVPKAGSPGLTSVSEAVGLRYIHVPGDDSP